MLLWPQELVSLEEQHKQAHFAGTHLGTLFRMFSHVLSIVGIIKFATGLWRVCSYFTGGRFQTVSQQADLVTTALSFVLVHLHLKIDIATWSPLLGSLYIACLALMHVRAFIVSMTQFAKLGIVSTSTEIYSLVLAYLIGAYSVACVLFLRTQLPLRRRRGVTIALGEDMRFDFFFWLFDAIFVVSTCASMCYLQLEFVRKKRLNEDALLEAQKEDALVARVEGRGAE